MIVNRLLVLVIAVEITVGCWLAWTRFQRTIPVLPAETLLDPVGAAEFRELAAKAERGGDADWQELAQALVGYGFYGHAEQCYRRALELAPTNRAARFGLAFCLDRTGRLRESTELYREIAPDADPETRRACLYAIGRNAVRAEQAAEAEQALESIRSDPSAGYHLALLRVRTGRAGEALPVIEQHLQALPNSLKFLSLKRDALLAQGEDEAATTVADRLERAEHQIDTGYSRSFVEPFFARYGFTKSIQAYNDSLSRGDAAASEGELGRLLDVIRSTPTPQSALIWTEAVQLEIHRGNPERALELIDDAQQHGGQLMHLVELAGDALAQIGDDAAAMEQWRRAERMRPNADLDQKLADAAERRGDELLARRHRAAALRREAQLLFAADRVGEAQSAVEESIDIDATNAAAWFLLGETRRLLDDPAGALEAYDECLARNPYYGRAIEARRRVGE